ncbi:hypothetical protein JCM33374_g3578 [Metschnikowia sp. JCM 33374]|nr:hypothetical protein JCM33374_g3578 [Metschnikowia sp. JCM 33374]
MLLLSIFWILTAVVFAMNPNTATMGAEEPKEVPRDNLETKTPDPFPHNHQTTLDPDVLRFIRDLEKLETINIGRTALLYPNTNKTADCDLQGLLGDGNSTSQCGAAGVRQTTGIPVPTANYFVPVHAVTAPDDVYFGFGVG